MRSAVLGPARRFCIQRPWRNCWPVAARRLATALASCAAPSTPPALLVPLWPSGSCQARLATN
eukprot:13014542-Alexandrium_andersonii.AAC.1